MLTQLAIQDYAIVDRLELDLTRGMTAITGETGAGKSILLGALGLCLGERADALIDRYAHVIEVHHVEVMLAVDGDDRLNFDARRLHVEQQEADALLWFAVIERGADQAKDPVGMLSVAGPDFGAVHDIVVAVTIRPCAQCGEVGAAARL